jgi:hypothetical protein
MLLTLTRVVFLGSESLETHDHLLLSQIWDFSFRCLLRLAGSRWRYPNPPPQGWNTLCGQNAFLISWSSYLTGITLRLYSSDKPVNAVRETVAVYCENHTKHINTLCVGRMQRFSMLEAGAWPVHTADNVLQKVNMVAGNSLSARLTPRKCLTNYGRW